MSVAKACGADKRSGAAEHSGVRRLRHRRLLTFLWLQGFEGTFGSLVDEITDAPFLHAGRLKRLVEQGRWRDAIGYLSGFLPNDNLQTMSVEAQVLHSFLMAHRSLDDVDAGLNGVFAAGATFFAKHRGCDLKSVSHGAIKLRYMTFIAFHAKQQLRVPLDWELVRHKASDIVYDLVHKTPELKRAVDLPAGPYKPHTVLPIRLISSRQSCHRIKKPWRRSPSAVANCFIRKRSLLSSSHSEEPRDELISKALSWTADLIDESLKASEQTEHHQEQPLHTSTRKEGATSASVSHTFGTLTNPARNHGMPSLANAGESTTCIPPLRNTFGALIPQPVVSSLTYSDILMMGNGAFKPRRLHCRQYSPGLQSNGESSEEAKDSWTFAVADLSADAGDNLSWGDCSMNFERHV